MPDHQRSSQPAGAGPTVRFVALDPALEPPARAHPGDGGVDLRTRLDVTLAPGERASVPTGIAVAVPVGYAGLVVPRSGLAARHGLTVVNAPGLVDAGYTGELVVILHNLGHEPVALRRGERVAQLMVVPVVLGGWLQVEQLEPTERGQAGFGSTGVA